MSSTIVADIEQILKMLPHRYPFLLIDRVVELTPNISATAIKNVTINENFFVGHFPVKPVMPGVLIIEAIAQASALFVMLSDKDLDVSKKLVYFTSIDNAKFRKIVTPGDVLRIKVAKINSRNNFWKIQGAVFVENEIVAEALIGAAMVDIEQ